MEPIFYFAIKLQTIWLQNHLETTHGTCFHCPHSKSVSQRKQLLAHSTSAHLTLDISCFMERKVGKVWGIGPGELWAFCVRVEKRVLGRKWSRESTTSFSVQTFAASHPAGLRSRDESEWEPTSSSTNLSMASAAVRKEHSQTVNSGLPRAQPLRACHLPVPASPFSPSLCRPTLSSGWQESTGQPLRRTGAEDNLAPSFLLEIVLEATQNPLRPLWCYGFPLAWVVPCPQPQQGFCRESHVSPTASLKPSTRRPKTAYEFLLW